MIKKNISIVIADDHPLLLAGLHDELENCGYNILGKATNGMEALQLILLHQPMIGLLDIDMPLLTGFEVIKTAKDKGVSTKFIILSFHKETEYITQAKALHINGYLLKEDSFTEIENCIRAVLDDKEYFSMSFDALTLKNASEEIKKLQLLTPSEITILKLIAQQINTNTIAENLFVSSRTVEKHRSNIITKLELEGGTNALTRWALAHKNTILEI
ncbi:MULTISPECIES: response regulator transcription factor [Altibacter]|uniref:response regulator transcription factor n=1 Tax=Altibacter TaxID=1535231 RepID=UPI00054DD999|nr:MULTISPECIES: response regulator transcription factor [Altibacter]MCW8979882.1 response regulator transcription factor [Altibacter sp.]MCW9036913.1 response regulator transcription factor [Altibacter sp.]